jgi:hypothetical protein
VPCALLGSCAFRRARQQLKQLFKILCEHVTLVAWTPLSSSAGSAYYKEAGTAIVAKGDLHSAAAPPAHLVEAFETIRFGVDVGGYCSCGVQVEQITLRPKMPAS